jgi:hypothetical protein
MLARTMVAARQNLKMMMKMLLSPKRKLRKKV